MSSPGVSVLLCSNKADDYMRLAVESILNQQYPDFELLIVANGAQAMDIVARYSGIDPRVTVLTTAFKGLTTNLNVGLHHCRHELIARMDADDIAAPHRLQRQVQRFETNPALVVCGSSYESISTEGVGLGKVTPPLSNKAIRSALRFRNPICHPSVMFRREAVMKVGGYLTGLHAEDYDLWVRMAADPSNVFENMDEALLQYRCWRTASRGTAAAYGTAMTSCTVAFLQGQGFMYLFGALAFLGRFLKAKFVTRRP